MLSKILFQKSAELIWMEAHEAKKAQDLQILLDRRWFPKLGRSGPIQIEAYHPNPRLIQDLPFLVFRCRLRRRNMMQVKIRCNSKINK
jgi:hypothetical protein